MKTILFKKLLLLFLVLVVLSGKSQNYPCSTSAYNYPSAQQLLPSVCANSSTAYMTKYRLPSNYIPSAQDPVITLKVSLHIFNKDPNAQNGWVMWNENVNDLVQGPLALNSFLSKITNGNSERFSEARDATYAQTFGLGNFINDSRIQYEVESIYYYYDQTVHLTNHFPDLMNHIISVDPKRLEGGMPIVINAHGGPAQMRGWSDFPVVWAPFSYTTPNVPDTGFIRNNWRHEIGHCFGLGHTYKENHPGLVPVPQPPHNTDSGSDWRIDFGASCGSIDYLSDVFVANAGICTNPVNTCNSCPEWADYSNNLMGGKYQKWMSPRQMGRRYRLMHLKYNGNNLRQYAKESLSQHTNPWVINSNETWDFDIQMYKDILVKAGSTLSITCKVAMATDGKIVVEKGAKLVIDGGEITGWCKKTPQNSNYGIPLWTGIEVDGNPNQMHVINVTTGYAPNHGIVEVKNGGKISHAYRGIKTSLTNAAGQWINNTSGGIVIADNAFFINNVIDIVLYKHQTTKPRGRIVNSQFKTTSEIGRNPNNTLIIPHEHIKLFENWGANIQGCFFEYAAGNIYPTPTRGAGIYATNSYFNLDPYCLNSSCTSSIRNKFSYMTYGVYVDNFNPLFNSNIRNSDFVLNVTGAQFEFVDHELFSDNNVTVGENLVGVYSYNSKYYKIRNNFFTSNISQPANLWGIIATDSKIGAHEIYRNTMEGMGVAINPIDENGPLSGVNNIPGLRMNCNRFNANVNKLNGYDIAATQFLAPVPLVDPKQGAWPVGFGTDYARNLYGASSTKWYYEFINGQTMQQVDHPSTPSGADNPSGQASPQVNIQVSNVAFSWASHCLAITSSGGSGSNNAEKLANMNSYINDLKQNNSNNRHYYEIQSTVSSKLNLFLTDSLDESKDSVVAILEGNQGGMEDADIKLVFAYMRNGNYSTATNKANALASNRSDWKTLLLKIMEIEQDSMGVYSLLTNTANVSFLNDYATSEGRDGQVCAQAILRFVFGTTHEYPLGYPEEGGGSRIRSLESVVPIIENLNFSVYPNPTSKDISIHYTGDNEEKYKVDVKDLLGKTIFTTFTKLTKDYQIPMSNLGNGMYLLSISNSKEELIYQTKIIKQN